MPKTSYASVRQNLIARRAKPEKWKDIGKDYPGVPLGTLCRIAKDPDYEPKDSTLRLALGLHPLHVTVAPLPCGCPPTGKRCPVHQPKSTRQPDPVVRVKRVDSARIAALSAQYANRGIGEARYRIVLKRALDAMTG